MNVIILAAGLGTRLSPLTKYRPKPLINYKGNTLIGHHISKLIQSKTKNILVNTSHGELFEDYFHYQYPNAPITVFKEPQSSPLGTAEGIRNMIKKSGISGYVLIISADIYTDFDYNNIDIECDSDGHLFLARDIYSDLGLANNKVLPKGELSYTGIGVFNCHLFSGTNQLGQIIRNNHFSGEIITKFWNNVGDYHSIIKHQK